MDETYLVYNLTDTAQNAQKYYMTPCKWSD